MTFTEYQTPADRKAGTNGVQLSGLVTGSAPGGGKWVFVVQDGRFHLVRTRQTVATSLAEDAQ
jgi:hypothetical protein